MCSEKVNYKTLSLKHNQNYTLLLIMYILIWLNNGKVQRGRNPDINLSGAFSFQSIISKNDGQSATQCYYNPQSSIVLPVSDTLYTGQLPHPGELEHLYANLPQPWAFLILTPSLPRKHHRLHRWCPFCFLCDCLWNSPYNLGVRDSLALYCRVSK